MFVVDVGVGRGHSDHKIISGVSKGCLELIRVSQNKPRSPSMAAISKSGTGPSTRQAPAIEQAAQGLNSITAAGSRFMVFAFLVVKEMCE